MFKQPIPSGQRLFGLGVGMRLAIVMAVVAGVTIPLVSVGSTGTSFSIPTPPVITGGIPTQAVPTPNAPRRIPVSYLTAAGVRSGLARVAKLLPGARLALVRLDGRSLIASARLRDGSFKQIVITPTGSIETPGASTGQRALAISQISPRAVTRLVTAMRSRFHVPADRIDYMVLSSPPGLATRWIIFSKAPNHPGFSATLAGTRLRRLPG